jgi:hypothetical protein
MSNRATGMAFLGLFTALLITLHIHPQGSSTDLIMVLSAFVFAVAGLLLLLRGDGRASR